MSNLQPGDVFWSHRKYWENSDRDLYVWVARSPGRASRPNGAEEHPISVTQDIVVLKLISPLLLDSYAIMDSNEKDQDRKTQEAKEA